MKQIVLPEIIAVGVYNAQLSVKNRLVTKNRKTTMFELELPIGEGGISYIDDTSHVISEQVAICAKPGQMRHTRLPFQCYYIHMTVNDGQLYELLSSLPNYVELEASEALREIFTAILRHHQTGIPEDEILLQSLVLKLAYTLQAMAPDERLPRAPKHSNRSVIEDTLRYINENLSSDLTLEHLSEMASFSPIYFHKLFKASTGRTLHEYIVDRRLQKAMELLGTTDMTLTQIAYECGFSSQSYFSAAFKKKMKITPREYTKALRLQYEK